MWMKCLAVGVGGFLGALARFGITEAVSIWQKSMTGHPLRLGTLTANVLGCFLIGLLIEFSGRWGLHPNIRMLMITGFLGSLTTFSTFSFDTVMIWEEKQVFWAGFNLVSNLLLGTLAVLLGLWLGRLGYVPPTVSP